MARANGVIGFLARLRRDARGNTLAIMAAAMIPLCGFAGSAIDMARIYVVKVRLQQACDAGVLAGRKFLPKDATAGAALTGDDLTQATTYFSNNLTTSWGGAGWYTGTPTFSPTTVADANGAVQVQGSAKAVVPMTIMRIFGVTDKPVNVVCQARYDTPDTDVMFVLDNTGSMACAVTDSDNTCNSYVSSNTTNSGSTTYYVKEKTSNGVNVSRIDSLRTAVNTFYSTVENQMDPDTHVRYGFVPYTSTVNVGQLIYGVNSTYFVSRASYQSRRATDDYITSYNYSSFTKAAPTNQTDCLALATTRTPALTTDVDGNTVYGYTTSGTAVRKAPYWNGNSSSNGLTKNTCYIDNETVIPKWTYKGGIKYDTAKYLTSATTPITDPSTYTGSTTTWNGCIEERSTTPASSPTSSFDINNLPPDLDPDLIPSSDDTRWTPMWPDVYYARDDYTTASSITLADNDSRVSKMPDMNTAAKQQGSMTCPAAAKLLFLPADKDSGAKTVSDYVASLRAIGGTYHDTGMIWGARMLSSTGIFRDNNAYPPGRNPPKKVVVFVTDGLMSPRSFIYGMYGEEFMDRRVTGTYYGSADPENYNSYTNGDNSNKDWHTSRFLAECARAKQKPMSADIWVVVVGPDKPDSMTTCASQPSQVLWAQTQQQLTDAFTAIAQQVAMLRVSQ